MIVREAVTERRDGYIKGTFTGEENEYKFIRRVQTFHGNGVVKTTRYEVERNGVRKMIDPAQVKEF